MEFGNVYEVLQTGDIVKVKDLASIYCGHIGVIVSIDNPGCYVDPVYTVRFDEPSLWSCTDRSESRETQFNAKNLVKVGDVTHEGEITMGLRSGKTYLTQIGRCKNKDNGFDSIIYQMEKKRKFTKGGTDEMKKIDVKKIIFNGPKTIVLWSDGTKTIVSMSKDEAKFDPEAAFCAAYTKKMFGTNSKIKRIIKEKSNYEEWKEKEEPDNQLYRLGLKALVGCEDVDLKAIESWAKESEKFQDILAQMMYEILTGHPYEGEKNNGND